MHYRQKEFVVRYEPNRVRVANLLQTVRNTGFRVKTVPTDSVSLRIPGITREGVVPLLRKALSSIDGVIAVDLDPARGTARITRRVGRASVSDLLQAVSRAGGGKKKFKAEVIR